jgi:hypothetical protein
MSVMVRTPILDGCGFGTFFASSHLSFGQVAMAAMLLERFLFL